MVIIFNSNILVGKMTIIKKIETFPTPQSTLSMVTLVNTLS